MLAMSNIVSLWGRKAQALSQWSLRGPRMLFCGEKRSAQLVRYSPITRISGKPMCMKRLAYFAYTCNHKVVWLRRVLRTLISSVSILISCCGTLSLLSAAEIEELTARAGSFKPFRTFTKMLGTALQGASDTVTLNVLTIAGNTYMLATGL